MQMAFYILAEEATHLILKKYSLPVLIFVYYGEH